MKNQSYRILRASLVVTSLLLASSCGALRATESMPDKMNSMLQGIDTTNQTTVGMRASMQETNDHIHKQTLEVALKEMMDPANSACLDPPVGMMAGGKVFAEEASALEIMQFTEMMLRRIDDENPDQSLVDDKTGKFPPAVTAEWDHNKLKYLMALQVVAGFLPDGQPESPEDCVNHVCKNTLQEIIQTQIELGGTYEDYAYPLLALRANFLKVYIMDETLLNKPVSNQGKLNEAVRLARKIDTIARLPYVSKIAYKTVGMVNPEDNVSGSIDLKMMPAMWDRLVHVTEVELDPRYRPSAVSARAEARANRDFWKARQP